MAGITAQQLIHNGLYIAPAVLKPRISLERYEKLQVVYSIQMGSICSLAESIATDLKEEISKDKKLYRFAMKKMVNDYLHYYNDIITEFRVRFIECSNRLQYQLWLDITDVMENQMQVHAAKLYNSLLTSARREIAISKRTINDRISALMLLAVNISKNAATINDEFNKTFDFLCKGDNDKTGSRLSKYLYNAYRTVDSMITAYIGVVPDGFCNKTDMQNGLLALFEQIVSIGKIEDSCREALSYYDINLDSYNGAENSFTPWNEMQDRYVMDNYDPAQPEESIKYLAGILGRSEGAIKARRNYLKKKQNAEVDRVH